MFETRSTPENREKVTIREVAQRAGVSIGTVSRALKNQGGLTEDTRQHVLRAAQDLGYDTSNLRQKIRRLSFVMSRQLDVPTNPFYSHVLHGVENACRENGVVLQYLTLRPGDRALDLLRRHAADALLCAGYFEPRLLERVAALGVPLVLIDHFLPGIPAVNSDNVSGTRMAVQHLLERGRRRIAFVNGPGHYSVQQRLLGFREALFAAGLPADPRLEVGGENAPLPEDLARATDTLLSLESPPDAVVCWNDECALSVIQRLRDRGLRVPQDVAVVGFDDIDAARHANPALTTVRVDKERLGSRGLELLQDRASGNHLEPVELIVRGSSQPGEG